MSNDLRPTEDGRLYDVPPALTEAEMIQEAPPGSAPQPICESCRHAILEVEEDQGEVITWKWDQETRQMVKQPSTFQSGWSDGPTHKCAKCDAEGAECGAAVPDGVVEY